MRKFFRDSSGSFDLGGIVDGRFDVVQNASKGQNSASAMVPAFGPSNYGFGMPSFGAR